MSLINEMLQNLDQRATHKKPQMSVKDFSLNFVSAKRSANHYIHFGFIFITLLFFVSIFWVKSQHKGVLAVEHRLVTTLTGAVNYIIDNNLQSFPVRQTNLNSLALQTTNGATELRFLLDKTVLYHVTKDVTQNEVSLIFENTKLLAPIPKLNLASSGIEDINAFSNENHELKVTIKLNKNAELTALAPPSDKTPEIVAQIKLSVAENQNLKPNTVLPTETAKPMLTTSATEEYQRAINLLHLGQTDVAEETLTKLVAEYPEYLPARKSLAVLLIKNTKNIEAENIINVGLLQHPKDLELIQLLARSLVNRGELKVALDLLVRFAPPLEVDPNYHALAAALYQRSGQASMAANIYNQLLQIQPDNALWWMGFAVSLETAGHRDEAVEAYTHAENLGSLTPELNAYVESRLQKSLA